MELNKSFKQLSMNSPKTATIEASTENRANRLPFLFLRKDSTGKNIPCVVKFLHSLDKSVNLSIHSVFEDRIVNNYLCEKYWSDKCKHCEKGQYIKAVKCLVSFVISLVGKQWSITKDNGEVKTGSYNAVRLAMIPLGRNEANVEPLNLAHNEKFFNDRMWFLSKSPKVIGTKTVNVLNPPKIIYEANYKKETGEDLPKFALPDTAEKYVYMSEEDIFTSIVSSFTNGQELLTHLSDNEQKQPKIENVEDDLEVDIF